MVCGRIVAVDIDIMDPGLALEIERLARERLGDTSALRIGRAPKRLLVYRSAEPFAGIRRAPIEVLGLGQQFVAHAIHPDTGQPYAWPEESLADLDIGDLPVIDDAAVRAFLDEALALVPEHMKPMRLSPDRTGTARPSHAQTGTMAAIREALAWIPNADLDYDSWVRVGLALKGSLGDAGGDLFAAWSAQSGKDEAAFTAKTWAGLRAERIGAGTIYHLAMERGWKPDPALVLDGAAPCDAVHPAAGLLAKVQVSDPGPSRRGPDSRPSSCVVPRGRFSRRWSVHGLDRAPAAAAAVARGEPLRAGGAHGSEIPHREQPALEPLRRRHRRQRLAARTTPARSIKELFFEAGLAEHLGGNKIASGAGLLTALHRQPALLLQIDEFGMFLAAAADRKRSPRHITEILDNMTELYTAAGSVFLGAEYANHDGRNERRDITQPCLCVYGTTTPLHFWNALQSANVVDGSLARFIILPTEEDYPEEAIGARYPHGPAGARRAAEARGRRRWPCSLRQPRGTGRRHDHRGRADDRADDGRGKRGLRRVGLDITGALRKARGTPQTAMLARVSENAQKLALIASVSRDPAAPVIGLEGRRVGDRAGSALRRPNHARGRAPCRRQRNRAQSQEDAGYHSHRRPVRPDEDRAHAQDAVPRIGVRAMKPSSRSPKPAS